MRELVGRVRRAGASGPLALRADSGFWSAKVIEACRDHDVRYSITVNRQAAVHRVIAAIARAGFEPIAHDDPGRAEPSRAEPAPSAPVIQPSSTSPRC